MEQKRDQNYFRFSLQEDWYSADGYCGKKGMKLVDIYSKEENDWIANKIDELGNE